MPSVARHRRHCGTLVATRLIAKQNPAIYPKYTRTSLSDCRRRPRRKPLPPLDRYQNYSKAQRQAYPPGAAPATEEALTRSLIELMRLEKDQSLTLEERAARAQQLYDTLPELSRVQRPD